MKLAKTDVQIMKVYGAEPDIRVKETSVNERNDVMSLFINASRSQRAVRDQSLDL